MQNPPTVMGDGVRVRCVGERNHRGTRGWGRGGTSMQPTGAMAGRSAARGVDREEGEDSLQESSFFFWCFAIHARVERRRTKKIIIIIIYYFLSSQHWILFTSASDFTMSDFR